MGRQEDKKGQQQRQNSALLQVPNSMEISDNGQIPLVIINDGAGDEELKTGEKPPQRKRSRGLSTVSMNSNSSTDVQELGTAVR